MKLELNGPRATILAAIIAVIGIAIGAFLNPLAEKVVNKPTPTQDSTVLKIEQLPLTIFTYDGREKNIGGWSNLGISYLDKIPYYGFSYSVPADQTGYAGIAFRFIDGQNISEYQRIEFTIKFDDKESEHSIDLYLADISYQKSHIRITVIGSEERKESHLLSNFSGVNMNAIQEITFNIDNSIAAGAHSITISNIRFSQ
jgi:hypothetical protein